MFRRTTFFLITLALPLFSACHKESKSTGVLATGDCLDQALSPYVLKIAAIEGETIFYYHLNGMGKKIYQKSRSELMESDSPFVKLACP